MRITLLGMIALMTAVILILILGNICTLEQELMDQARNAR